MSFDVPPLVRSLAEVDPDAPVPIPAEVWDEVDAAARLADELHAQGRAVRFDVRGLGGGVRAELIDQEGHALRRLSLTDVVDVDRLAHELGHQPS
jgi:hypothetical protein